MIGSNSYLSLTRHPRILKAVHATLDDWGIGAGGPPLLNGTTLLHEQLERRLAHKHGHEDCVIFPSGFQAQVGWVTSLVDRNDVVFYDEGCHASFYDGLRASRARSVPFRHNDVEDLRSKLELHADPTRQCWLTVEGVYSMDGDLAPLPEIVDLAEHYGCRIVIDDAHGSGILGVHGAGTVSELGVDPKRITIHMGTFSKTYSMAGGFLCGSHEMISFIRYMARTHMFSAALPATTIAGVLACLDVIEDEPERVVRLHENVRMICTGLQHMGYNSDSRSGIIPIRLQPGSSAFEICAEFERRGIFVNGVQYPAVPRNQERLRVSVMSEHQPEHIDHLLGVVEEVLSQSLIS
jgi:8-amino-7-oxononanoate synthase